ncbi:hypothetical protein NXV78_14700 [Bacteroides cellulosilyticus]|nr:hypothetical protein [Bacteroides cellulosilyticus]MCQ4943983.1 hypothetical protein [Bacteroides cellulosilyticus]MCS3055266.1 hypothetical protein [Bacteroides cellulosilyticus]
MSSTSGLHERCLIRQDILSALIRKRLNKYTKQLLNNKEYTMSEIANYFLYRNAEGETGLSANSIDDLNLDDLFAEIDYCHSSIGRQYLYYLLLSDKTSGMEKQEALLSSLATHTELRTLLSNALKELDKPDAYSIVSILENDNTGIGAKEMVLINICRFLPLLFLALMLLTHSGVFLTLFVFSFVANAVLHYRNKAKIQRYFFSIPQLLKMIRQAGKLAQNKEFISVDPSITTDLKAVEGLKKYISYFRFNLSLDNDMAILFYMAAELIRVFFLHEAYAVGRTFHLLKEKATAIHNVYRFIGFLDSILSVAILREELPYYCLPGDNRAGERLRTQAVYHPLIENCIPNDMVLHEKSALITGSNMAGKTCFMRTIGVNLLAAKTLHTCFAEVFEINTGISLLSSIHQGDNLMENKSYFMQEVTTIKDFVDESGHGNHLFLLDELFRGTNTKERIAISKAVLSWLVKSDNLVFVSTHDLELADMLEDEYELYYFSESVKDGILSFDYKLKRGVATEHNAIKILEICDYPASLVSEAHSITSI